MGTASSTVEVAAPVATETPAAPQSADSSDAHAKVSALEKVVADLKGQLSEAHRVLHDRVSEVEKLIQRKFPYG